MEKKNWIQDAVKHKGALRKEAKREHLIEGDEKLSMADLNKLEKKGGKTAKRAVLAKTLRKFYGGGEPDEDYQILIFGEERPEPEEESEEPDYYDDDYASGGKIKEKVFIEYLNKDKGYKMDRKYFNSYQQAERWARDNFDKFNTDYIRYEYAVGGEIEWGEDLGDGFSVGNDVYITDSKSMYQGKTGFVSGLIGKDLLVTISENGNERNVFVSKKGVEKLDAPEYADGGKTIAGFPVKYHELNMNFLKIFKEYCFINSKKYGNNTYINESGDILIWWPKTNHSEGQLRLTFNKTYTKFDREVYNDFQEKHINYSIHYDVYFGKWVFYVYLSKGKESNYNTKELIKLFDEFNLPKRQIVGELSFTPYYAHGGMTPGRYYKDNKGEEFRFVGESNGKLLFKDGEKVITKSEEDFEEKPQEKKLFKFFRLGGEMEMTEPEESQEYYASMQYDKGGEMDFMSDEFESKVKDIYAKPNKMAKGGEVTFDDKVKAISKKLVGKPVPAPYRKEYGTRYDKEDAKEAASRIVGNMRKMYGE